MTYAYNISDYECVGDALGKINYNFLNIDSQFCQLSSMFFLDQNSFYTIFNDLSASMSNLNNIGDTYNLASLYRQSFTAVTLLSAYWGKPEITIQYPVNFVSDVNNNIQAFYIAGTSDQTLSEIARIYLTKNFSVSKYLDGAIINVSFLIYSSTGDFVSQIDGPYQNYPVSQFWNVNFSKADVNIAHSRTFKFEKISSLWVNIAIT